MVAEKTLAQRPELVQRFLRGTLKGFLWLKTNEKEVVPKFAAAMKISDSEAADVYKSALKIMSADGTIPRALQEKMIAFQRDVQRRHPAIEKAPGHRILHALQPFRAAASAASGDEVICRARTNAPYPEKANPRISARL